MNYSRFPIIKGGDLINKKSQIGTCRREKHSKKNKISSCCIQNSREFEPVGWQELTVLVFIYCDITLFLFLFSLFNLLRSVWKKCSWEERSWWLRLFSRKAFFPKKLLLLRKSILYFWSRACFKSPKNISSSPEVQLGFEKKAYIERYILWPTLTEGLWCPSWIWLP